MYLEFHVVEYIQKKVLIQYQDHLEVFYAKDVKFEE